jgi:hypothetical protein
LRRNNAEGEPYGKRIRHHDPVQPAAPDDRCRLTGAGFSRTLRSGGAAVIWSPADGSARFTLDQPSDHFGSFGNAAIAAIGVELDRKVATLLEHLGVAVPDDLPTS